MVTTVVTIIKISGKSIQALHRAISLLKLSSEEPELSATFAEILNIVGKSILTLGIPSFEIATPHALLGVSTHSRRSLAMTGKGEARRPEDQFIKVRETVSRIVEISGKSTRTMLRTI